MDIHDRPISPAAPASPAPGAAKPAGLPRRLAAITYDLLLLAGLILAVTFAVVMLRGGREVAPGTLWFTLLLLAVVFGFFGWFWTHGGQTLGMRAWRIRVVTRDGGPVGWRRAALRFACGWLSLLPAGLGFLYGLVDAERAALHDRLSDTRLVYLGRRPK